MTPPKKKKVRINTTMRELIRETTTQTSSSTRCSRHHASLLPTTPNLTLKSILCRFMTYDSNDVHFSSLQNVEKCEKMNIYARNRV